MQDWGEYLDFILSLCNYIDFLSCTVPLWGLCFGFGPSGAQLWFRPHPSMWAYLRYTFSAQVRARECSNWLGHLFAQAGREKVAIAGACVKCLWWQRPGESCKWLGCAHSGGNPPQGQQGVPNGGPTPCVPFYNGASFPRQSMLLLEAFPVESLTPVPSGCLWTANSGTLPGSAFKTSCFCTQPWLALAASWGAEADPGGSFGMDSAHGPSKFCIVGGLAWGTGEPAQMGPPPSAHGVRG